MSNALQRVLTALIAAPVVLVIAYIGGWLFAGLVAVAGALAQHEFYALGRSGGARPFVAAGLIAGVAVVVAPLADVAIVIAGFILVGVVLSVPFTTDRDAPLHDVSVTLGGVFYPSLLLAAATALRSGRGLDVTEIEAFGLLVTVLVMVWASDTMAYLVGRSIGKRPLAPAVSPKKTWEGTIGGAVGALIVGATMKLAAVPGLAWEDVVVLGLICGGVSQIGDLAESRLKRSVGVKDSGTILPGHGGLLDRLDALIIALPLAYLYLMFAYALWK